MRFIVGDEVTYKQSNGVVSFVTEEYVTILVTSGTHRSQDVKVVAYASDYRNIEYANSK